jgi:hypothetical protein
MTTKMNNHNEIIMKLVKHICKEMSVEENSKEEIKEGR